MSIARHSHDFAPLPPEMAEAWAYFPHWEGRTYFVNVVGLEVDELRTDYARMSLPYREENLQAAGLIHGGVIATLIDTVVVPPIGTGLPGGSLWSTIELHVQYHRPLVTGAVAEGWVVKRGRSITFTRAEVYDVDGNHVASGTATYMTKSETPNEEPTS